MNRFPPDFNANSSLRQTPDEVQQSVLGVSQDNETANPSEDSATPSPKTVRKFKHFYLILLVIGLFLGILTSVGVVAVIGKLGLTDAPAEVEGTTTPP